jgi:hypothetical protein
MNPILQNILGKAGTSPREFKAGSMRIYEDVIEFRNKENKLEKVYRISNVSALVVFEKKEAPLWLILAIGGCLLTWFLFVTIPIFFFLVTILYQNYIKFDKNRLDVILNAGSDVSTYIVSRDLEFLRDAAEAILELMNDRTSGKSLYINVDQRKVNTIKINGPVSNSPLVAGDSNNINPAPLAPQEPLPNEPVSGMSQPRQPPPEPSQPTDSASRLKQAAISPMEAPDVASRVSKAIASPPPTPSAEPPSRVNRPISPPKPATAPAAAGPARVNPPRPATAPAAAGPARVNPPRPATAPAAAGPARTSPTRPVPNDTEE